MPLDFKSQILVEMSLPGGRGIGRRRRAKLKPIAFAVSLSSLGRGENLHPPTTPQQIHIVCSTKSLMALRIGTQVKRSAGDRQLGFMCYEYASLWYPLV